MDLEVKLQADSAVRLLVAIDRINSALGGHDYIVAMDAIRDAGRLCDTVSRELLTLSQLIANRDLSKELQASIDQVRSRKGEK